MWFTGNGRYASFWTKDQTGAIKCCGYNGNYELGIGNTNNQSSAVEPKWQVNTGTTSTTVQNLENIKDIGCNSAYGNQWMCSVHILTYDGFMFTAEETTTELLRKVGHLLMQVIDRQTTTLKKQMIIISKCVECLITHTVELKI